MDNEEDGVPDYPWKVEVLESCLVGVALLPPVNVLEEIGVVLI